jgi:uncharacterized membrane protein YvbJ
MEENIKKAIIILTSILVAFILLLVILYINKYGLNSSKLIEILEPEKIIFTK